LDGGCCHKLCHDDSNVAGAINADERRLLSTQRRGGAKISTTDENRWTRMRRRGATPRRTFENYQSACGTSRITSSGRSRWLLEIDSPPFRWRTILPAA
jgi:hypothetical protein